MKGKKLTAKVISCGYKVHNVLGPGFLEKDYLNALRVELENQGLNVQQQAPITVYYEQQIVGEFNADLYVEEVLIIELKAVRTISKQHEVQSVGYLAATGMDVGLLINFGPSVQVRRKYREYRPPVKQT